MYEKPAAHSRAPQILSLLHEYGPLSVKGLETIIRPRITKRRMQEALLRLYQKGLVIKRFEASPFSRQYYELSQSDAMRKVVNDMTGIPLEHLIQPYFRSQELLHNEECAFWAVYFKSTFPDADVVRDFRIRSHNEIENCLLLDKDDHHFLPDIVIYFHETTDKERVLIPVEIELTRKSDKRLYRKLSRYMKETRSDGLIYLCHKNTLLDVMVATYKQIVPSAPRVEWFAPYFMLFGDRSFDPETKEPRLFNQESEPVSLTRWVQVLRESDRGRERLEKLRTPARARWLF